VLAYPNNYASYPVSVRQYRTLQSRCLQFMPRDTQPCDLLMLRRSPPVLKGLSPSGNKPTHIFWLVENKFVFLPFFYCFRLCVYCSCRAHTNTLPPPLFLLGDDGQKGTCFLLRFVPTESDVQVNPAKKRAAASCRPLILKINKWIACISNYPH
jgi:hypothetical protein